MTQVSGFDPDEVLSRFTDAAIPVLCTHAQRFFDWGDELCSEAVDKKTVTAINQAKVLLVDRYMMWRKNVPISHQADDQAFADGGHACVLSVFEWALQRLLDAELALAPPALDRVREVRETAALYNTGLVSVDATMLGQRSLDPEFG
jgi:hypothetical protein